MRTTLTAILTALCMIAAMPAAAQSAKQKKWKGPKRPKVHWKAPKKENLDPLMDMWRPYTVSDNWWVDLHMGMGGSMAENMKGHGMFSTMGTTVGAGIGKQTSYLWSTRLGFLYASQRGWIAEGDAVLPALIDPGKYKYNLGELWLDERFSLTNAFCRYNEDRPVNIYAFVGAGVTYAMGATKASKIWELFDNDGEYTLSRHATVTPAFRAGLQAQYAISPSMDLWLKSAFYMRGDRHNARTHEGGGLEPGMDFAVGMSFHLQDIYGNYRYCRLRRSLAVQLRHRVPSVDRYMTREDEKKREQQEAWQVEYGKVMEAKIRFYVDREFINGQQMDNVRAVAEFIRRNPEVHITVRGYSGVSRGGEAQGYNLARLRAEAVAQALTHKFGIDESRITVWYDEEADSPTPMQGEWIDAVEFEMSRQ